MLSTCVMLPSVAPGRIGLAADSAGNGRTPFTGWLRLREMRRFGAARSEVADGRGEVAGQLALHVDVPRAQRGVAELRIDGDRREADRLRQIDGAAQRNRSGRRERRRKRRVARRVVDRGGARLVDRRAIGGAHDGAAVAAERPRQPEARLDVVVVLAIDLVDVDADAHAAMPSRRRTPRTGCRARSASCAIRSAARDRRSATGRR